ncbi:MAG: hypothetical protein LBS09_03485 [Bacteroidales bacterium]|nr:hypothetical protein [Bacteroidales bacterium]
MKIFLMACILATASFPAAAHDSGLLFYLSGNSLQADVSKGEAFPNFVRGVEIISGGAKGNAFRCAENQLMSYWAHGNIYAQRGTLSFFWRAGDDPFTETEFPVFRVGYSDHSSWDMTWLRIDYNGKGFDAFVTDANLARVRVSYTAPQLPAVMEWTHFAFAWDEMQGIRFYVNGKKVGQRDTTIVFDAGLDQFGPHSRIISPYQVQSAYNFRRGGDIDEIRIYDRALDDAEIRRLFQGEDYRPAPFGRSPNVKQWVDEWHLRYGWTDDLPPYLAHEATTVRKVQILEAYDLKTWWWKANDGIRETTWPGVYNRSRIIGRNDYFQLPDWFCYSLSGQQVRFNMPDNETWNYFEVSGGADGQISVTPNRDGSGGIPCFVRAKGKERTFHKMKTPVKGQTVVFSNNVQETPIGEFDAFYVHEGDAPQGIIRLAYRLSPEPSGLSNPNISDVLRHIKGRHPTDEQTVMTATPSGAAPQARPQIARSGIDKKQPTSEMPLVHIVIPSDFRSMGVTPAEPLGGWMRASTQGWYNLHGGLDGIRIILPAMDVPPLTSGLFPMNIRVKDPIWYIRDMLNFSFSVKPNEERVLWLDLRDRILPNDKPLYLTIAGGAGFNAEWLEGARIELVFKERDEAKIEHLADRFTQVRDNYSMIVEEHPNNRRLHKYVQFENDITDLLRIDPEHKEGREYWHIYNPSQPRPPVKTAPAPEGVPLWAHLQLEYLKKYRYFIEWQIEHRQIENGEFGGGLSDDSDLGNYMPPLALMGVMPDKIEKSLSMMMEAIYDNDMLVDGISKLQSDGLHTFEEGTNTICQINLLRTGNPKEAERMMEAAHTVKHHVTGVNAAGHTHFRSDYFSATKAATKGVWGWADSRTFLHLLPTIYLGEFYGVEAAKQIVTDMADGLLAHADTTPDGQVRINYAIHFETDEHRPSGMGNSAPVFWAAWRWTGNDKYLKPLLSDFRWMGSVTSNMLDIAGQRQKIAQQLAVPNSEYTRHLAWQLSGDKRHLETLYRELLETATLHEYVNTLGYVWTDRYSFSIDEIQRSRLGGVSQDRSMFYPGNAVSWRFPRNDAERIAILVPFSTPEKLKFEFFNTGTETINALMTGWDVLNGEWELVQGIDGNGDGKIDRETHREKLTFGRGETVTLSIPSQENVLIQMKLTGSGISVTNRSDLAIGAEDVQISGNQIAVTVHNLGGADAPATEIALTDRKGEAILQTVTIPALEGVHDLLPKRVQVTLQIPQNLNLDGCRVVIDPKNTVAEIRKTNNSLPVNLKNN